MSKPPKIWLSSPHLEADGMKYVQEAFETNWIAPLGPNVDALELAIKEWLGIKSVTVLSSATAAIHLGLVLLGVTAGDEVICQSATFAASAFPIKYLGASPVFVDSEEDTWNVNPELLRNAIEDRMRLGKRVKAIIPVHLYGVPANIEAIMALAAEYQIPVLEDAADALGARYKHKACGTFGDIGVISFNGNKIITTSGGGALVSNQPKIVEKARFLATQARDNAPHYQHSHIGYNYRMSNVCAGIGLGQMQVLDERVMQRRANYAFYVKALGDLPGISFLEDREGAFSNRWLTCILVDPTQSGGLSREIIRVALEAENIESRPLWKPMHLQPIFADAPFYGDGTSERLFDQGLCLPSGSNLSQEDLDRVVYHIRKLFV
jgi:dTDP-4-amino-4,6-dideoxygalactose transaminase